MTNLTIEQLEALKEGTTEGPWEASVQSFAENEGGAYSLYAEVADKDGVPLMYAEDAFVFHREPNFTLAAAAPALVDALIAEKQAHQETLHLVRELWSDVHHHGNVGRASILRHLTRILEADNE